MKAAALAACLLCSPASAAVLTVSQPIFEEGDLDATLTTDNFLPAFDPSLGTLQAVQVKIRASLQWAQLLEDVSAPTTATTHGELIIDSDGAGGNGPFSGLDDLSQTGTLPVPAGFASPVSGTFAFTDTVTDDPANFLISGEQEDILLIPDAFVTSVECSGCFSEAGTSGLLTGTLTTRFFYRPAHPVPEPSSLALLAIGAVGMAATRRHRTFSRSLIQSGFQPCPIRLRALAGSASSSSSPLAILEVPTSPGSEADGDWSICICS